MTGSTNGESTDSSATINKVRNLESEVTGIKGQLSEVLSLLKTSRVEPASIPADPAVADVVDDQPKVPESRQPPASPGAYAVGTLQFTLPAPSANTVAKALAIRQAYGDTGKLNLFEKPKTVAPYPAKRFIPEPAGLFGRIKNADARDGFEAEVLWNLGHDSEVATAAFHQVAQAIADKDWDAVTEAVALAYQFHKAGYERVKERVDFFADSLESGKAEAILLQKYLREDDQNYTSALYRDTRKQLNSLRDKAFAKELVSNKASQGKKRNPKADL